MHVQRFLPLFSLCAVACASTPGDGSNEESVVTAQAGLSAKAVASDFDFHHRGRAETIFVIAMENHNFTQPNPTSTPQQILGNPAAPYINSLVTPGNTNAAQACYARSYYNAGASV